MAQINFNAAAVAPIKNEYTPIPKGTYLLHTIDSSLHETKANDGSYLKLVYEVLDGQFKGRRIYSMTMLVNNDPVKQSRGQTEFSALCHAVGETGVVTESSVVHYRPFSAQVYIQEGKNGYGPSNSVDYKTVCSAGSGAPMQTHAAPFQQAAAAPAAANSAPAWARKAA